MKAVKFVLRTVVSGAAICNVSALPAFAESGWVIAGEYGQKPDRIIVLVDIGEAKNDETRGEYGPGGVPYIAGPKKESVNESVDAAEAQLAAVLGKTTGPFISIPMFVVYESVGKPAYSDMTIRNFCERKINDISWPLTFWRDNRRSTEASAIELPAQAEVLAKVFDLTCGDTQAAFVSGGFKPVMGEYANKSYPVEYPWGTMWADGKRPEYAKSDQATIDAKLAEIDAKAASSRAMLASAEAIALGQIEKSNAESEFWIDQAERRKYRPKSKLNPFLEGWLRQGEQYIVQNLGVPDGVYQTGNSKFLTYFNGWSQIFTTTDAQSGQVVSESEQSYVCELTMELQDDKMIDFKFKGNSCGFGEFAGR